MALCPLKRSVLHTGITKKELDCFSSDYLSSYNWEYKNCLSHFSPIFLGFKLWDKGFWDDFYHFKASVSSKSLIQLFHFDSCHLFGFLKVEFRGFRPESLL